jgi:hypothetical protein
MEPARDRLRDLSARLLRLHRLLLDRERRAYETQHGSIPPGALLRLLLQDDQFAWLRSLSTLIADIDGVVDGDEPVGEGAIDTALRRVHGLLKGGRGDTFERKYHAALQESPDVVMAHAAVSKVLPASVARPEPS